MSSGSGAAVLLNTPAPTGDRRRRVRQRGASRPPHGDVDRNDPPSSDPPRCDPPHRNPLHGDPP
eukprot:696377-Pleurochrysis_carterae.AAC.1